MKNFVFQESHKRFINKYVSIDEEYALDRQAHVNFTV